MSESTSAHEERKTCTKCGESKPLDQYIFRRDTGKLRGVCRSCQYAANRKRYREDPEVRAKHRVHVDRWHAQNPTFAADYYQQNRERLIAAAAEYEKANPRQRRRDCDAATLELRRQRERDWYAANRERRQAVKNAWQEANPDVVAETRRRAISRRRARLRGLPSEPYTMAQLIERDGMLCVLCDRKLNMAVTHPHPMSPTVEHLECISWPGSAGDVLTNVAVAHYRCNNDRRANPHPAAARKRAELLAASEAAA